MTIKERMVARNAREKDLLKFGRSQERERIIKLLADRMSELKLYQSMLAEAPEVWDKRTIYLTLESAIALIKGEK